MSKCRNQKISATAHHGGYEFRCDRCGFYPASVRDSAGHHIVFGLDIGAGLSDRPGYNALSTADYRRLYGDALVALHDLSEKMATPVTHMQPSLWLQWKYEKSEQTVEVVR